MIQSLKQLYEDKLGASDGEIGHVKDFYFDDRSWVVRYLVAETGSWLTGRQVLLTPHSVSRVYQPGKLLLVNLTRKQIENSPSIALHKPVSRQYEEEYYHYYGWPNYWQGDGLWGTSGFPTVLPSIPPFPGESLPESPAKPDRAAAHLRSTQAVNGYSVQASDGIIGHLTDFMLDDQSWAIRHLVVKTGHRLSGKEVQISAGKVSRISYEESTIFVSLTGVAVEQSPAHHLVAAGAAA